MERCLASSFVPRLRDYEGQVTGPRCDLSDVAKGGDGAKSEALQDPIEDQGWIAFVGPELSSGESAFLGNPN